MTRTIRLSLEATSATVKMGEMPGFRLTVRNDGASPERVTDIRSGRRPGLQDSYYDLEVRQGGKMIDVPRIISDPGPLAEEDFLELGPGGEVTFALNRFASMFDLLPP